MDAVSPKQAAPAGLQETIRAEAGQIVLVFQGGGALGAYQAGVYHALHKAGIEPDWIIGTSIGAINAALIVGNAPGDRLAALQEFWHRISHKSPWSTWPDLFTPMAHRLSYWSTLTQGVPSFFEPNPAALFGPQADLGAEAASYYTTAPLRRTLEELTQLLPHAKGTRPRLTIGTAAVRSSQMRYFDSRDEDVSTHHIMASGALPPAFPAVRIDGELYWDGGILSNTPTEVVFDDNPRRNSLIFAVHMWHPSGDEPNSIWDVMHRQKEIQYSSRVSGHVMRQTLTHRLRHIIKELGDLVPKSERERDAVKAMLSWGCTTRMHVVRLLAPRVEHEDQTKDVDFSPAGIRSRWQSGYADTNRALEGAPWRAPFDPIEGVIMHDPPYTSTKGEG